MDDVFRVPDRWGRVIVLTSEQWLSHVVTRQPDMVGRESLVMTTVTLPSLVTFDRRSPDREVFYHPISRDRQTKMVFVRVVVEFSDIGRVITAHFIHRPHVQETSKWP